MDHAGPTLDAVILGGGVAGLWTLSRLNRDGYAAALVSAGALGAGQTVASQGIIHGGIKYALIGAATRASAAIAPMPALWDAALRGEAPDQPDLRGARVLASEHCLWTTRSVASRIAGVAASKVIRTGVRALAPEERAGALSPRAGAAGIDVYAVAETVLDPRSLVEALAADGAGRIVSAGGAGTIRAAADEVGVRIAVDMPGGPISLRARRAVLCAGDGNAALLAALGVSGQSAPQMQRRPLHMVLLRASPDDLPPLFAHCLGLGPRPRVTVTTQRDSAGRNVWYVGGEIAEAAGVARDRDKQIMASREELAAVLPWLASRGAFARAEWATLRIDRAEGLSPSGDRPDEPVVRAAGAAIACWPTKLAFAPAAAEMVSRTLREQGVCPSGAAAPLALTPPPIAALPWEDPSIAWT